MSAGMTWYGVAMWSGVQPKERPFSRLAHPSPK